MDQISKSFCTSVLPKFMDYKKKYKVHGIVRRVALEDKIHRLWRLKEIENKITLHTASMESYASIVKVIEKIKPNEIYHLAAQSYVSYSFEDEFSTINTNVNGTHFVLSAIKEFSPKSKFYFAGSSEMFGKAETPQKENTPFRPRSPYGISKVTGYELTRNYREAYNLFSCSGILFNHETPRRGYEFVTRKISYAVARMNMASKKNFLGNIKTKRDLGQQKGWVCYVANDATKKPTDFAIATGKQFSVEQFAKLFLAAGLNYRDYIK